jgi:hypothetical protein
MKSIFYKRVSLKAFSFIKMFLVFGLILLSGASSKLISDASIKPLYVLILFIGYLMMYLSFDISLWRRDELELYPDLAYKRLIKQLLVTRLILLISICITSSNLSKLCILNYKLALNVGGDQFMTIILQCLAILILEIQTWRVHPNKINDNVA